MSIVEQARNELTTFVNGADPITYDFPKQIAATISSQVLSSKAKFSEMVDISDPRGLVVVWIKKVGKELTGKAFDTYEVIVDFSLRVPLDPQVAWKVKNTDSLFNEAMASLPEWSAEKIDALLAGKHRQAPPQVPGQGPGMNQLPPAGVHQPYQPPSSPFSTPATPRPFAPPTQAPPVGATTSAAELPCLGSYNFADPKCRNCPQQGPCLNKIQQQMQQQSAAATASPITPPRAGEDPVAKANEAVKAALALANATTEDDQ